MGPYGGMSDLIVKADTLGYNRIKHARAIATWGQPMLAAFKLYLFEACAAAILRLWAPCHWCEPC